MPKVSVIIPVYNTEKYLRECLDSVINQTLTDIEIICINDGSTDGSLEILNEYAKKDKRIKIINQKNYGVSVARNAGIQISTGEYITFLDGDDYLEPNCINDTSRYIKEKDADILIFGFYEIKNGIRSIRCDLEYLEMYKDCNNLQLNEVRHLLHNACGKIYNLSFLRKNKIEFIPNVKSGEDGIFNFQCLCKAPGFAILDKAFYNYRIDRVGSLTNSKCHAIKNDINAFKQLIMLDDYKNAQKEYKIYALQKAISGLGYYFHKTDNCIIKLLYAIQIFRFRQYLYKHIDINLLKSCNNLNDFQNYTIGKNLLKMLFSIINTDNKQRKLVTILGIRIKFKVRSK